jgi:nitrogen fixation protein FixH
VDHVHPLEAVAETTCWPCPDSFGPCLHQEEVVVRIHRPAVEAEDLDLDLVEEAESPFLDVGHPVEGQSRLQVEEEPEIG